MGHYMYMWCKTHNEHQHLGRYGQLRMETSREHLMAFMYRHSNAECLVRILTEFDDEFAVMCDGTCLDNVELFSERFGDELRAAEKEIEKKVVEFHNEITRLLV
jgi:hypothetical protein